MKCSICGKEMSSKNSHNAEPINKGRCCDECNIKVIIERIKELNNNK
jgi:DNA-directed RNA polymerase subunit RPC12/RpoP